MKHKEKLGKLLEGSLAWHGSRIDFLACFLLGLIQQKSVNWVNISLAFASEAQAESNYRRIQRFFQGFSFEQSELSQVLIKLLPPPPYTLCLDRTNWQFGTFNINILMLSIAYKGIAFPVTWMFLGKRGNSNTQERKQLMERFLSLIEVKQIAMLVADREFIGRDWFKFLNRRKIPFTLRIRQDALADANKRVTLLFKKLKIGHSQVLTQAYSIYGVKLNLCALRLDKHDWLILVTNRKPKQALKVYQRRWQIEMLFAALKKTGFDLESTHLACDLKLDKLLSLVSLALTWAHAVGEWLHTSKLKPLRLKAHDRPEKTFFRHGLDFLRSLLCNPLAHKRNARLSFCINLLSCT
jgi:Transposase DDE domain